MLASKLRLQVDASQPQVSSRRNGTRSAVRVSRDACLLLAIILNVVFAFEGYVAPPYMHLQQQQRQFSGPPQVMARHLQSAPTGSSRRMFGQPVWQPPQPAPTSEAPARPPKPQVAPEPVPKVIQPPVPASEMPKQAEVQSSTTTATKTAEESGKQPEAKPKKRKTKGKDKQRDLDLAKGVAMTNVMAAATSVKRKAKKLAAKKKLQQKATNLKNGFAAGAAVAHTKAHG